MVATFTIIILYRIYYKYFAVKLAEQCEYANGNGKWYSGPGTLLLLHSTPNAVQRAPSSFLHRTSVASYHIETVFELRVRTQALCIAEQNEPTTSNSPSIPVWTTKETGACVLSALLLKLIPQSGLL